MVTYQLMTDGAFVAGDTETGRTSYAYPTSANAAGARRRPLLIAKRMIAAENSLGAWRDHCDYARDFDVRNWARLCPHAHT